MDGIASSFVYQTIGQVLFGGLKYLHQRFFAANRARIGLNEPVVHCGLGHALKRLTWNPDC